MPARRFPRPRAPARRGFAHVLHELASDTTYTEDLLNPQAPWLRRYKGRTRTDIIAAINYMASISILQGQQTSTPRTLKPRTRPAHQQ